MMAVVQRGVANVSIPLSAFLDGREKKLRETKKKEN
jgi:hypothetical protein